MVLNSSLFTFQSFGFVLCLPPEFGWDEQSDAGLLRSFRDVYLHAKSSYWDGRDDDINTGESALDGFFIRIVDWDHFRIAVDGCPRSLVVGERAMVNPQT